MAYNNIIFEKQEEIAIVKFNRPKSLNAINMDVVKEIEQALDQVESDSAVRVLILTGEGDKAFVAGADISQMVNLSPLELREFSTALHRLGFRMEDLPIPIIACVNGFALGGGTEIAMASDFIYASEDARFGQPEINLGIIPGFGGTQRLPRLVGKGVAKELCMTGAIISAQEAKEIGLVNRVFPADKLWEETMKTAKVLASKGKFSLMAVKRCIDRGYNLDLRAACAVEADQFALCMANPDGREGMTAFLEKRKPDFKGELS
ncbi:MAG: enoyl-CoA hydratase/isomerase family protein [Deltaproteobacteria bacterium]|nr:enoyl-CoA hydratase/isomerase family protein [Deltaproteobacteria bacterium]MBW2048524.1 enoyl-CoA hydratase/isomerase family protein [Deltaproteobacteria bacterium]HDZ90485.1 enoyl-CoA hydratase/isomerase family protein [Deltaproteobacteria bacterium]